VFGIIKNRFYILAIKANVNFGFCFITTRIVIYYIAMNFTKPFTVHFSNPLQRRRKAFLLANLILLFTVSDMNFPSPMRSPT